MLIYFDKNKRSYDEATVKSEMIEVVASTDYPTWLRLGETNDWDIDVENGLFIDLTQTPEYQQRLFNEAKENKIKELLKALTDKSTSMTSTLIVNLPATLKKGDEVKQVTSYKLLTNTSGGNILNVLANMKDVPDFLLSDSLVTSDGYTVLGLAHEVEMLGMTKPQIYFIWLTVIQVQGQITVHLRDVKENILACTSLEELEQIEISFDDF